MSSQTAELYLVGAPDICIAQKAKVAQSFISRLIGLLGRSSLKQEEALIIKPCADIHTIGMRFPIDVVFVDKKKRVVKIVHGLKPFRLARASKAKAAIELSAGAADRQNIKVGDELYWIDL